MLLTNAYPEQVRMKSSEVDTFTTVARNDSYTPRYTTKIDISPKILIKFNMYPYNLLQQ